MNVLMDLLVMEQVKERRAAITKVVGLDVRKTFHICAQKNFVQQKMGMLIIVVVQIPFLVVQNMVDCEFVEVGHLKEPKGVAKMTYGNY